MHREARRTQSKEFLIKKFSDLCELCASAVNTSSQKTRNSRENKGRITGWLPRLVGRVPATVHSKLLVAFLTIVVLLIAVGVVGLQLLSAVNRRAEGMVKLQRKIAAYRQLQHGTTAQLYSVTSALLLADERTLSGTLRQLNQFGYDLDRLQFVARDEAELLSQVQKNYDQFVDIVTKVVELIRAGKVREGRELQLAEAGPLADRLERLTNQLVNRAAADVVASIETSQAAYLTSRWVVICFAVGSIGLALILGYAFSWSVIGPVKEMDSRLKQIASGDFSEHVEVLNRDELGTLATNLNRMNDELGQLYKQLETANRHKSDFLASMSHEFRTPLTPSLAMDDYCGAKPKDRSRNCRERIFRISSTMLSVFSLSLIACLISPRSRRARWKFESNPSESKKSSMGLRPPSNPC